MNPNKSNKPSTAAKVSDEILNYPFDLYQRSRNIAETVEIIARETGQEQLKILDVGGFRLEAEERDTFLLKEFLPSHDIYVMDLEDGVTRGYVKGDGTQLPFKDNAFDVVVSSDVFEHVPAPGRQAFVENLLRVSSGFVILGAPFFTPKAQMAEEILYEYVYKVLHTEQVQLKEHIDNGLPRSEEAETILNEINTPFISVDSGNLNNWLMMMMVKHYLMALPDTQRLHRMLDRFYNMSFYESDHAGDCYRKVFVASKANKTNALNKIKEHFSVYADQHQQRPLEDADFSHFRMLLDLESLRSRRQLEEKDRLIAHHAGEIAQLNEMRTMRLYKLISFFTTRLFRPFSRISRFFLYKLQLFFRVLTGKRRHPFLSLSNGSYARWIAKNASSAEETAAIKKESAGFAYRPLISIVVPVFNTESQWIEKAVDSVLNQVYDNWELCLVNDGSPADHVRVTLDHCRTRDTRIKVKHLRRNRGIAGASNAGLEMATGEFIAFMDSDDELHPTALYEVVKLLNSEKTADVIYTDEDKLTLSGERIKPVFKEDWSEALFLTYNYINHLTVCRKSLIDEVGGFRKEFDWSQDYDLYLRVTEKTDHIHHIPKVLYHWRMIPGSSASRVDIRMEALAKSRHLLTETLRRRGINGIVTDGLRPGTFKIKTL